MLQNQKMLRLYEQLGRARALTRHSIGARLARGFADVGFEEFSVLPGERLLSLLTGEISSLTDVRREHLFEVLSANQLVDEIHLRGYELDVLECVELRTWRCLIKSTSCLQSSELECGSLEELLLRAALFSYQVFENQEERCLKTVLVNH